MQAFALAFTAVSRRFGQLGLCANSGMIAGFVTGLILSIVSYAHLVLSHPFAPPRPGELALIALMLAALGWLCLIFALVLLGRLQFRSVALPALFTTALVVALTVWLTASLSAWAWSWLLGLVVGLVVGFALCLASRFFPGVRSHGV
jgi:hypothetical protein